MNATFSFSPLKSPFGQGDDIIAKLGRQEPGQWVEDRPQPGWTKYRNTFLHSSLGNAVARRETGRLQKFLITNPLFFLSKLGLAHIILDAQLASLRADRIPVLAFPWCEWSAILKQKA